MTRHSFDALEIRAPQAVQVVRDVQAWTMESGARVWFGRGKRDGSMIPVFTHAGSSYYLFAAWTYGAVEIYFNRLKVRPPFDDEGKRLELLRRLNEIPGVVIPPDGIGRRPSIRLETLAAPEHTQRFLEVLAWTLQEIRAVPPVQDAQESVEAASVAMPGPRHRSPNRAVG